MTTKQALWVLNDFKLEKYFTRTQTGNQILKTASTGSGDRKLQFEIIYLGFFVRTITQCLNITLSRVTFAKSKPLVQQNQLKLSGVNFLEAGLLKFFRNADLIINPTFIICRICVFSVIYPRFINPTFNICRICVFNEIYSKFINPTFCICRICGFYRNLFQVHKSDIRYLSDMWFLPKSIPGS